MSALTKNPVVHSYDVTRHRVRCDVSHPDRSTKHANGVTCTTCRELLVDARRAAIGRDVAPDATLGA